MYGHFAVSVPPMPISGIGDIPPLPLPPLQEGWSKWSCLHQIKLQLEQRTETRVDTWARETNYRLVWAIKTLFPRNMGFRHWDIDFVSCGEPWRRAKWCPGRNHCLSKQWFLNPPKKNKRKQQNWTKKVSLENQGKGPEADQTAGNAPEMEGDISSQSNLMWPWCL